MFAHTKAATMPATSTVALPDSVRTNDRNGADRSRAHAVRCCHRLTPPRESARSVPDVTADLGPGEGDAPWPAAVSPILTPLSAAPSLRDYGERPTHHPSSRHGSGRAAAAESARASLRPVTRLSLVA